MKPLKCLSMLGLLAFCNSASAHTGGLPTDGFMHGFVHPFLGLDHFLAMSGLGLWASSQKSLIAKQAIGLFLAFMLAGALSGLNGFEFAYVETAILLSLLAIGFALSLGTRRLPKSIVLIAIASFAAMHGLTHGSEMPVAASAYGYIAGIMTGTASLLFLGWALGLMIRRIQASGLIRLYGSLAGVTGVWLLFHA